ncbi:MAG: amidohydrolase [Cyclobacteriaceae bacterium]|nr:amidohydrolase [Cyclobacteriaceae bacterium]
MKKLCVCLFLSIAGIAVYGQPGSALLSKLDQQAKEIQPKVIQWRREFHEHPELSNQEFKTGKLIAEFLKSLGLEVQYPVARTGVVAILKGSKPGPVIALRADMDALPVNERNSLPFTSKEKATLNGVETGVMHACGHDSHMAILMGVAEVLSKNKNELKGTVKFIFQPAEETYPIDQDAGAVLMVKEGVLDNPKVDVIFGLHIQSLLPSGQLAYRAEGLMAAVDGFDIKVSGVGAHGATPWDAVDPIVVSGQILVGLQTIVSRQINLTNAPAVITVGSIHGGIRRNIIPEEVIMQGTIRTFDMSMQKSIHEKIKQLATSIAAASGAKAEVLINPESPLTYNDPKLTAKMTSSLVRTVGEQNTKIIAPVTMAEDFSFYQEKIPGLFFFLGAYPADMSLTKAPVHHTADFMIDEKSFVTGVRAMLNLTVDYMFMKN